MRHDILTALDIGSGSVKGLCCRKDPKTGLLAVLAQAERPCFIGVRAGEVVRPEEVAKTIQRVKSELGKKADAKIKEVFINIGGSHLSSVASQGLVSVSRADQKISQEDIVRVLKAAEAINLSRNREILDCFPKEFIVDGEGGIKDPLGLEGIRLEVKVTLVTVFAPVLENLNQAVELAGLQVANISLSPLACAEAVLTQEQKELGVVLVDIGFGITSMVVFEKGDLVDFAIFPVGSGHITNDIAIGLRTEIQTAESIKQEFATLEGQTDKKKTREKIKLAEKNLEFSKKFLRDIVEARVSQMFAEVQKNLKKIAGEEPLPSGVVLSGGGSKLPGIVEFAKQKFKLPCRQGHVQAVKGFDLENDRFAVCLGLVLSALDEHESTKRTSRPGSVLSQKTRRLFRMFLP